MTDQSNKYGSVDKSQVKDTEKEELGTCKEELDQAGESKKPSRIEEYKQPGRSEEYKQPGRSAEFKQPGRSAEYEQPGRVDEFGQPRPDEYVPQPGHSGEYLLQSGDPDEKEWPIHQGNDLCKQDSTCARDVKKEAENEKYSAAPFCK